MSHLADVEVNILKLAALKRACEALGLELVENQKTFRWYGRFLNDWSDQSRAAIFHGYTAQDFGKCEHAIKIKNNSHAYEIGLVARKDGKPGWNLLYDAYAGGFGLEEIAGKGLSKLKQEYAAQVAHGQLKIKGYAVQRVVTSDGRIQLIARR